MSENTEATEATQEQVAANCERLCKIALIAAGYAGEFDAVAMDCDDERPHVRVSPTARHHYLGYLVAREQDGRWSVEQETSQSDDSGNAETGIYGAYAAAAELVAMIASDRAICAFSNEDMEPFA